MPRPRRLLATVTLVLAAVLAAGPLAAAMILPAMPAATPTREPLGAVAVVLVGAAGGFAGGLAAVAAWQARVRLRPRRTTVPA